MVRLDRGISVRCQLHWHQLNYSHHRSTHTRLHLRDPAVSWVCNAEHKYTCEEHKTYKEETFWKHRPGTAGVKWQNTRGSQDTGTTPSLQLDDVNHLSIEAHDVQHLVDFYVRVLGFRTLPRPKFVFDGAWLTGGGTTLHVIEADPSVPLKERQWKDRYLVDQPEPWYIRRGRHTAYSVPSLQAAEEHLQYFGIEYNKFLVPGTDAAQVFFFDPEGNGIELGQNYEEIKAAVK